VSQFLASFIVLNVEANVPSLVTPNVIYDGNLTMRQCGFFSLPVSVYRCSTHFQPSAADVTNTSQLIALLNKSIIFLSSMTLSFLKWQFCFGKAGLSDGVQEVFSSFPLGRQICVLNRTLPCLLTHFSALDRLYILKLQ